MRIAPPFFLHAALQRHRNQGVELWTNAALCDIRVSFKRLVDAFGVFLDVTSRRYANTVKSYLAVFLFSSPLEKDAPMIVLESVARPASVFATVVFPMPAIPQSV